MTAADWAADDALIEASLLAGPTGAPFNTFAVHCCRWCDHAWHGRACEGACKCDGAYGTRDDSWRPPRVYGEMNPSRLMHAYGIDGWSAYFIAARHYGPYQPITPALTMLRERAYRSLKGHPVDPRSVG